MQVYNCILRSDFRAKTKLNQSILSDCCLIWKEDLIRNVSEDSYQTQQEKHPPPLFHLSSNLDHDIIPDLRALQSKWSALRDHERALRRSHTLSHIQALLVPADKWPIVSQGSPGCSSPSLQNTWRAWSQSNGEQSSTAWAPFPGSTSGPHPDCNTACYTVP